MTLHRVRLSALTLVLCTVLAVASCGSGVSKGEVIQKKYEAAHSWIYLQPQYTESCSGKPLICSQRLSGYIPIPMYEPDHWTLKLQDCSGDKCKTGWVDVDSQTYHDIAIGAFYSTGKS